MLDDRRRDHVSLSVGQGLLFSADLEPQREPHVVAQFLSDGWCPGHAGIRERNENKCQGTLNDAGRWPSPFCQGTGVRYRYGT
jgi:hypothetical protein